MLLAVAVVRGRAWPRPCAQRYRRSIRIPTRRISAEHVRFGRAVSVDAVGYLRAMPLPSCSEWAAVRSRRWWSSPTRSCCRHASVCA